jgi:mono/diheme cytochrome c family protein
MMSELRRDVGRSRVRRAALAVGTLAVGLASVAAISAGPAERAARELSDKVQRGRQVVIEHGCGDCHGGGGNPSSEHWLAGMYAPEQETQIGPFKTRPRNLTPDNTTGLGRFTERQIFNAIRYGLRPGETPDVEITSTTPGKGNFPLNPKYLAIPMPWPVFRHMTDEDIWALAAYLKQGVKPKVNKVPDSEGPPDFWASEYTVEKIGTYPAPAFPAASEVAPK